MTSTENQMRASLAREALNESRNYDSSDEGITDIMVDCLHLIQEQGLNPEAMLKRVKMNFDSERYLLIPKEG